MKVLYKPFGVAASVLGGLLAGTIFKRLWKLVAGEDDSPNATDKQRGWGEILVAAALEGALFGAVKAGVDRAGATGFERVTGAWPGDEHGGEKAS
jgi:predicted metal-dependent enzyme (double-stranded beta helix superfamily)